MADAREPESEPEVEAEPAVSLARFESGVRRGVFARVAPALAVALGLCSAGLGAFAVTVRAPLRSSSVQRFSPRFAFVASSSAPPAVRASTVSTDEGATGGALVSAPVDATPGSPGAARVLGVLGHVRETLRSSSYQHDLHVDERAGVYRWDCSLMASWVLARAAPRARAGVRTGGARPLAVDYYRTIRAAPPLRSSGESPRALRGASWGHVTRVSDARPGDVLAWQRPRWFRSHNTGHVAFVLAPPEPYTDNTVLVRIADASSYNHENDSRAGATGYGEGTLLVAVDPVTGAGTGYGWFGRAALAWIVPTEVVIGRPMR